MVIDPIGTAGAGVRGDLTQDRLHVPEVETIPPVNPAKNYPSSEFDTQSGGHDGNRGQRSSAANAGLHRSVSNVQEEVEAAQQELNAMLLKVNQRLSFRLHEGSERMTVQVIDNKTNEVVREMPPEKFLDTIAKMREFIGLLFDDWV